VGVHGDRHWPLPLLPPWSIRAEIERCAALIESTVSKRPRFYRPPFGFMTPGQAKRVREMGYEPVLGDVYPEDPHRPGTHRIVERVLSRVTEGSIVILHDGAPLGRPDRGQTLAALEIILARTRDRGLRAVSVAELIAPTDRAAPAAADTSCLPG